MTRRLYAIGDIHGHLSLLHDAHARIAADRARMGDDAEAPVVHIGDLVDRGPESAGVIAHLMEGQAAGQPWIVLKGNHDRMFQFFMEECPQRDPCLRPDLDWLHPRLGGLTALASYGLDATEARDPDDLHAEARAAVPQAHLDWVRALPDRADFGPVFLAHAGVRPGVALARQEEDDLLWIRAPFHASRADHGALIVHGHTPEPKARHYGNRVNIDSGAAYGGPLTTVVIEGTDVFVLDEDGTRQRLRPGLLDRLR